MAGTESGWADLFWDAFRRSKNAMALVDDERRIVDVNGAFVRLLGYPRTKLIGHPIGELVEGGPMLSTREWHRLLKRKQFAGQAHLVAADGRKLTVEFAGHPELVTGRQLVLFVALMTGRRRRADHGRPHHKAKEQQLSQRELEIVGLIALGYSGPEIADELHLTHNTVRTHVRNAMRKLGARSRAHLVAKVLGEAVLHRDSP